MTIFDYIKKASVSSNFGDMEALFLNYGNFRRALPDLIKRMQIDGEESQGGFFILGGTSF